jgi:hypothetical protein
MKSSVDSVLMNCLMALFAPLTVSICAHRAGFGAIEMYAIRVVGNGPWIAFTSAWKSRST